MMKAVEQASAAFVSILNRLPGIVPPMVVVSTKSIYISKGCKLF